MTPQSVEDCLQTTLSSLYPPFEVTAPTLLSQVFSVLERTYREDPLRYTLEFLIPAKRILQNVQHQACAQYSGFLFFHEGWPLCLGDKILIQLSSLPWHFLKPGDFYLQVVPYLECSPRLVLKCLSQDGSGVQEIVVHESSHSFIFSAEWLNSINKDRSSVRLENCLAAVEEKVLRLQWSEIIYPRFIHKEGFIVGRKCPPCPILPPLECRSPGDGGITSVDLVEPRVTHSQQYTEECRDGTVSYAAGSFSGTILDCVEGEYVELSPPNKSTGENTQSYRDFWLSRAKTAPSRKGKKKGHQAWLHEKKPGKIGSLSTLKGMAQDTWEERLCTGATGEQCESTLARQCYWDVDTSETDLMNEWKKGLNLLQKCDVDDIHSDRQVWVTTESQTWMLKDCSQDQGKKGLGADSTVFAGGLMDNDMLSKTLEVDSFKIDIPGERENIICAENVPDISSGYQRDLAGDVLQHSSLDSQTYTAKDKNSGKVDNSSTGFKLESSQTPYKQTTNDMNEVETNIRESSLTKKDRTWADGQETSKAEGLPGENIPAEYFPTPSDETKLHIAKEDSPTWSQITDTPHKTGRGRRKKRNKKGRGPLRPEARKETSKVNEVKIDATIEPIETFRKTEVNEEEDKLDHEEIEGEIHKGEPLPLPTDNQADESSCVELKDEPNQSPSQSTLLPECPTANFKRLLKDVNWDLLESGFICLTGGQDRDKKALLLICPDKAPPSYSQSEFEDTLSYLHSLLRPELREWGMTLLLDLRDNTSNKECLFQMLKDSKDSTLSCVHRTLFLCNTENRPAIPCDIFNSQVVLSLSELNQFIESEELPEFLGGERPYIHTECVWGQQSLSNLYTLCSDVLHSLEEVTQDLDTGSIQDTEALICHHRDAMKRALSDEKLQLLQRDGGILVARLQKSPYLRLYDTVTFELYEKVDEALHRLVQLSNQRLQELEDRLLPQALEDSLSSQDATKHHLQLMEAQEEARSLEESQVLVTEPESRRADVGVRIRGLEVSSRELADRTCSPPRGHVLSRGDGRGPDAPWGGIARPEGKKSPQRLLLDLLCSERSYVQSLRRSLEVRRSCPASLALRGSLEQLLNFHTYFLRELQNCVSQPLTVSYSFLQHAEQFRLYSLYVKNRQKVELFLPAPTGSLKGRRRDQKEKEEEESWAILQRPLEQLDQYQRFLDDMIQECDQDSEQERQSLHTARELVGSLVHHGKNLLAAEAIRGFEVDEKEHGRLSLKDVFTVCLGRKKSLRHVFLFQKLLLFSKLKTAEGGMETYSFKQAYKTADMGITESSTDGDTRIELWFRRPKSRETVVLQADNVAVKEIWTNEITKLLWDQGGLSKDSRSSDTTSLGSSHRSFLDIKAGFSAISERTVGALLTARGSRARSTMVLPSCEHGSPSPPSSLSLALTSGLSPRRLRSPGGGSLSDKISEGGDTFTGGPVCLKSISPIKEGEKPRDFTTEGVFPSTSV